MYHLSFNKRARLIYTKTIYIKVLNICIFSCNKHNLEKGDTLVTMTHMRIKVDVKKRALLCDLLHCFTIIPLASMR